MARDALLNFGTIDFASTNLAALAAVRFPDTVDCGQALRDIGTGNPLMVEFHVETTITATAAFTFNFCLWSTSVAAISSATLSAGGATTAALFGQSGVLGDNSAVFATMKPYAGVKVYMPIPPWPTYDLTNATQVADASTYKPFRYLVATAFGFPAAAGTLNAGTVSARIVKWEDKWRPYPSGFVVA